MSSPSSDHDRHCNDPDDESVDLITDRFNPQLSLDPEVDNSENKHDDNDDDFTFMLIGEDDLPFNSDNVIEDGQIRQVFPLFDQNLLLNNEYDVEEIHQVPIHPPVDRIFIESPRGFPSENDQNDGSAVGPYCAWSKESVTITAELSKKSNSTGFSKLWRLREKVNRSNSDGRDAFVFLKKSDRATTVTASVTPSFSSSSTVKPVNGDGKARVVKTKKATVSAHEAYLKSKGGHTEEERRRTYLPYRPELMGFFTNVHGGLSKNVHPY